MKKFRLILLLVAAILVIAVESCNDKLDDTTYFTTTTLTLAETLESMPDDVSMYVEVLQKTGYLNAFKSYGSYTCFAPNNAAVLTYISERWGASSISELTSDEQIEGLKQIVKFHTLATKKFTSSFDEGRLADTTYTGDYLTATFAAGGGLQDVLINKTAKITKPDVSSDNGVLHVLDQLLDPFTDMLPEAMEKSGKYTIFVEALRQTGLYDFLLTEYNANGSRAFYTIFAETDEVFAAYNINSFEDLAAKYSPDDTDYSDKQNELYRFIAYHAVGSFLYTSDLPDEAFVSTVLENNALKVEKSGNVLKINETETGVNDTWLTLITAASNNPVRNGVYHSLNKMMDIFIPLAKYMLFDVVSDQPEVQSKAIKAGSKVANGSYQYINWYPEDLTCRYLASSNYTNLNYNIWDVGSFVYMEFVTPVLPKGKYELLACANGGNSARGIFQVYWDGEPIGSVWDVRTKMSSVSSSGDSIVMEAAGWRHGLKWITNKSGTSQYDSNGAMRRVITKELLCPVQQRHTIKLETIKSGGVPLDYFEFIPVN
ncbi:fasciclin domain-containing protein [Mangrovibacterium sp.]|uniref:fasciclin domain-containing protein n=1 Tax=Mangrovibacterium sp. TaxID=1961364 RepID=UPI0035686D65